MKKTEILQYLPRECSSILIYSHRQSHLRLPCWGQVVSGLLCNILVRCTCQLSYVRLGGEIKKRGIKDKLRDGEEERD